MSDVQTALIFKEGERQIWKLLTKYSTWKEYQGPDGNNKPDRNISLFIKNLSGKIYRSQFAVLREIAHAQGFG